MQNGTVWLLIYEFFGVVSELMKILTKWGNKLNEETWKERNAGIAAEAQHLNGQLKFY